MPNIYQICATFVDRTNKTHEGKDLPAPPGSTNPDSPEPEPVYVNVDPRSQSSLDAEAQPPPVPSGPGRPLVRSQAPPSHPRLPRSTSEICLPMSECVKLGNQRTGRLSSFVEKQARGSIYQSTVLHSMIA